MPPTASRWTPSRRELSAITITEPPLAHHHQESSTSRSKLCLIGVNGTDTPPQEPRPPRPPRATSAFLLPSPCSTLPTDGRTQEQLLEQMDTSQTDTTKGRLCHHHHQPGTRWTPTLHHFKGESLAFLLPSPREDSAITCGNRWTHLLQMDNDHDQEQHLGAIPCKPTLCHHSKRATTALQLCQLPTMDTERGTQTRAFPLLPCSAIYKRELSALLMDLQAVLIMQSVNGFFRRHPHPPYIIK